MNKAERKLVKKEAILLGAKAQKKRKVKKALKGRAGDNLVASNGYLKTLLDPFSYRGYQIPDWINYPSTTFSVVDRRTFTVDAGGIGYCTYGLAGSTGQKTTGSLIPHRSNDTWGGVQLSWLVGQTNKTTQAILPTSGDLFPNQAVGPYPELIFFNQWTVTGQGIPGVYDRVRLVSAGISVDFTGNYTQAQGEITLASVPAFSRIKDTMNSGFPVTLSMIQSLPDSCICPVNGLKGGTALYKPFDERCWDYVSQTSIFNETAYVSMVSHPELALGELYAIATGCAPGTVFQVNAVFNYEAIPYSNTLDLFQMRPSKSDPISLAHAMNKVQEVTPVLPMSQTTMNEGKSHEVFTSNSGPNNSSTISQTAPKSEKSMMDRFLEWGAGAVEKAVPWVVEKLTPLVLSLI